MIPYLFYTLFQSQYIKIDQDHFTEPTDVLVDVSQDVDLENSAFFYQGNPIFSKNNELMFTVKDENESVFKYILKDKEGNILEENEHSFYLDTQAPLISASFNDFLLDNTLYIKEKSVIRIQTSDMYLKNVDIYVDDVLVSNEMDAMVEVGQDSKQIKIVSSDLFGHETIKIIDVFHVFSPTLQASVKNDEYILDPHIRFTFDELVSQPISLVVYIDGVKTQQISCLNQSEIDVYLDQEGDVSFKLVYDNAEYLNFLINGLNDLNIHFTNQLPSLELEASSYLSSSDIHVYSTYQTRYLKRAYYEVFDERTTTIYEYDDILTLSGQLGTTTNYVVKVFLEDMFGQIVSKEVAVSIDRQAPSFSLLKNNMEVVNNSSMIVSKEDVFDVSVSEQSDIFMTLYKNGECIQNVSLNQAIQGLSPGDVLEVEYAVSDALKNTNQYRYSFELEKPKFSSNVLATTWKYNGLNKHDKSNSMKYTWKVDKNNRLILDSLTKIDTNNEPNMDLVKKDHHTYRLILGNDKQFEDNFETIEINGKAVDLSNIKKDKLNQSYYEFKSLDDIHIKAVVKDAKGSSKILEKEVKVEKQSWFTPLCLGLISTFFLGLIYSVKKLKNAKTISN